MKQYIFAFVMVAAVGACGGSSGGGSNGSPPGGTPIEVASLGVEPRYYGLDGANFADLQGQTVRVLVSGAEFGSGSLTQADGMEGLITFLDDGSGDFVFNHPNTSPWTLSPSGEPGEYEYITPNPNSSTSKFATLTEVGDVYILSFYIPYSTPNKYNVTYGAFGFETPIADRPAGSVSYSGRGIIQISDNQSGTFELSGTSELQVDFGSAAVSGTLLHVDDNEVDLDGDGQFDDRLVMTMTLENGTTDLYGVKGQVSAAGQTYIGIAPNPETLDVNVTASGAVGAFYGPTAGSLGVVYDGEMTMALPESTPLDYEFGGLSVVHQ